MRIHYSLHVCLSLLAAWSATHAPSLSAQPSAGRLEVVSGDYPRVFFFRSAEGFAANPRTDYEAWDACFSRLMGIEGKVLDEEVPGRAARNSEFFTRFKRRHPDQLVLLHYNGHSRDPRYQAEKYFAGHFIYHNGATILESLPATPGEIDVRVDNPTLFRVNGGRYKWSNDDVALCAVTDDGRPDWHTCEQTQLVSINLAAGTIRVRRACYGTEPLAFEGGKSYAAAHGSEGPWGRNSNLMWHYNYSTRCPRDSQGRSCSQVHAEELAARFLEGGELEAFDGVEFDVLSHQLGGQLGGNSRFGLDCDGDGQIDNGLFDGVNEYGVGVVEFCRLLRERMGRERLILADGMSLNNQRAFGVLNGIESEGWPSLSDWEIKDWSGGLNRHWFWSENGAAPVFNYVNHKFTTSGPTPGSRVQAEVPWSVHRLVFASCMFTDSAICYAYGPPKPRTEMYGIWDELQKGTQRELGWLGRPVGPAVRLATSSVDLLQSAGRSVSADVVDGLLEGDGSNVRVLADRGVEIATDGGDPGSSTKFRLHDVPCDGPNLLVTVTAACDPRAGQPEEIARLAWVGIAAPEGHFVRPGPLDAGMCLRGHEEAELDRATGASAVFSRAVPLGGETHDAYRVHPPCQRTKGYTFWRRQVVVPPEGRLEFFTGMGELSPRRSDGVWFRVLVAEMTDGATGTFTPIFEHTQKAFRWTPHSVSLAEWAGRRVALKFVADCGPNDNATTDHAHWGDVFVVGPEGRRRWTPPERFMTWMNGRGFTSSFYFSDVRSASVDLEFSIEGPEPVRVASITAHAHLDAIYREFDRGVVLANPSPRPFEFNLARLLPGRKYRRLQGSLQQDPISNDGSAVGETIVLGPLDGLFLVNTH